MIDTRITYSSRAIPIAPTLAAMDMARKNTPTGAASSTQPTMVSMVSCTASKNPDRAARRLTGVWRAAAKAEHQGEHYQRRHGAVGRSLDRVDRDQALNPVRQRGRRRVRRARRSAMRRRPSRDGSGNRPDVQRDQGRDGAQDRRRQQQDREGHHRACGVAAALDHVGGPRHAHEQQREHQRNDGHAQRRQPRPAERVAQLGSARRAHCRPQTHSTRRPAEDPGSCRPGFSGPARSASWLKP